ncbi:MAG: glycoside hydrolase family 15 protein [Acidimicrobiales bacterium]
MNTDQHQAAHKPESAFDTAGPLNGDHGELVEASVQAMLANQQSNGAFIASPDFGQYQYCWLRDASFVAHALDRVGELQASALYHNWVAKAIEKIAPAMDSAVQHHQAGLALEPADMSPARFSLAGLPVSDDWPNFQIDGYGIWLWSLQEHLATEGSGLFADRLVPAVEHTARYLAALALTPCFDVWEEDGASIHTSTLACVYGGLLAAAKMLGDSDLVARAEEVQAVALTRVLREGRFEKSSASREVDASLLWLSKPFGLVDPSHPAFVQTAAEIAEHLEFEGGIRRYPSDTYYGGGAWPVLNASLGWYYASVGDLTTARRHLEWIAARFDGEGRLAEQFGGERRDPVKYEEWFDRWGPPAKELLWSHAMFVIFNDVVARAAVDGVNNIDEPKGL